MENLQIVHEHNNEPTGVVLSRAEAIQKQHWVRSTNVFVLNSLGEILCHRRSMLKERLPGVWSTHLGGHVCIGETYETNAIKELHEESGIKINPDNLIQWRTTKQPKARLWIREYVALLDIDAKDLKPQPGEVDEFAWKSITDIVSESAAQPEKWCAGTHDIMTEYQCMRAVLTAASSMGIVKAAHMQTWNPPVMA